MTGILGFAAFLLAFVLIGTLLAGLSDALVVASRRIRRWWNA